MGGRGLKSIEQEYKELKIKTAFHLYTSTDQAVKAAAQADQARRSRGRKSLMKDVEKYAKELGVESKDSNARIVMIDGLLRIVICKDSNDRWTIKCTTDATGENQ